MSKTSEPLSPRLEQVFPDAASLFGVRLKPLQDIKATCLVVLDTNVLLMPYSLKADRLDGLAEKYRELVQAGRLFVPAQVAREFAKNRSVKLGELNHQLGDKKSKSVDVLLGGCPLLEKLGAYRDLQTLEEEIAEKVRAYKQKLGELIDHVRSWTWNDPVSELYAQVFNAECIVECGKELKEVDEDLKRRADQRIPPGYKDGGKDENTAGDLIIWHTILMLGKEKKRDLVFVSADAKSDWFHQSGGSPLYPRFELVDEYRRASEGASFHMLTASKFLDLFHAQPEVVQSVEAAESRDLALDQELILRCEDPLVEKAVLHLAGIDPSWELIRTNATTCVLQAGNERQITAKIFPLHSIFSLGVFINSIHANRDLAVIVSYQRELLDAVHAHAHTTHWDILCLLVDPITAQVYPTDFKDNKRLSKIAKELHQQIVLSLF